MNRQLLLLAKAPVPGRVKTRLCPPCSPAQAAIIAHAALRDTIDAATAAAIGRCTLVIEGSYPTPAGWWSIHQRGLTLGERIAAAFADTARPGVATILIGMDTPQATTGLLDRCAALLDDADGVLGPAADGGWWLLGLSDPDHAAAIAGVPTSRPDTGSLAMAALVGAGVRIATGPTLRDVDTAADARTVAALAPGGRFADAVRHHLPDAPAGSPTAVAESTGTPPRTGRVQP